jgi:hypothetical protein
MRSHAGLRPPSLRRATSQNPPDYHVELATTSPQPRLDLHPALLANASLYADGGASTLMTTQFANEVGLLRTLARNLILKPSPSGPVTQDFLRDEGLARVRRQGDGLVAILRPGHEAFTDLSESVIGQFPAMERGMMFSHRAFRLPGHHLCWTRSCIH